MGLLEKLLSKSNSYIYYKNGYESLVEENRKLAKKTEKINSLKKENKKYKSEISDLKNQINGFENLINVMEVKFQNGNFKQYKNDIKTINIAYVLYAFPIHSETFVVSEVKWLKENGFNVVVFTRHPSHKPVDLDFDVTNIRFNNIVELKTLLLEYDIDLVHTHFVYPMCTNFTFPVCEKLAIPFTVFAHAYDIFVKENDKRNKIDEISNSKYCLAIFTLSEFHKNYLTERNANRDKIVITKQATNYEALPIEEKECKIKKIVSVSRFVEKKGLDILIDAAKLLEDKDFEFSIYGFGNLEKDLQKQIDDLGCKNISIKGELPPEEVKDVLNDADLFVSPCKVAKNGDMDGFPTVAFESMAIGLPVLTTAVSAIPEIIEDGVNGFIIEPENPEKLASKIVEISQLPNETLLKIIKQAQNDVTEICGVEKTMNKYIETIKL